MKAVHRICNASKADDIGRLMKFRVKTCCGRPIGPSVQTTDNSKQVTCRNCLKTIGIWQGKQMVKAPKETRTVEETFDVHFILRARKIRWDEPISRPVTNEKVAAAVDAKRIDGKRLFKAKAIATSSDEDDYGGCLWAHGVFVGSYFIEPGSRKQVDRGQVHEAVRSGSAGGPQSKRLRRAPLRRARRRSTGQ